MTRQEDAGEAVRQRFRRIRIMTLAALMATMRCSRSTVQRRLKQWRCHTSYNLNGAYYALPEVVEFDRYGIWRCKQARFSIYGNLTATVVGLVQRAQAGLNCAELSAIMDVNAHSFMSNFLQSDKLTRSKYAGSYVYFSPEQSLRDSQQAERRHLTHGGQLADCDAVVVLVELLKAAHLRPAELSERVRARAPTASAEAIRRFFLQHDIKPAKKGAPHSAS